MGASQASSRQISRARRGRQRPGGLAALAVGDRHDALLAGSVTATEAKNEFGQLLEKVIRGARVFITKHDRRKAVLLSVEDFESLAVAGATQLDNLSAEFDALLAGMQTRKVRAGMKAAFDASPRQLGRAAVEVAKKRG